MTPFFLLWQVSGAEDQPPEVDGSGLIITRRRRKPARPIDTYRTPEDIRREQLEVERYLESLKKPQQGAREGNERDGIARADSTDSSNGAGLESATSVQAPRATPAADPILADVAARAASAVQAKLEEADSAAALGLLAKQQRHRTLVLLLALD